MTSRDGLQETILPKRFSVAIVGGGISGLVLAIGLQRQKIPVTLYEAAAHFGEIGAGVSLGPNAVDAMTLIDPAIKKGFDRLATYNQLESSLNSWFDVRVGDDRWGEKNEDSSGHLSSGGWFYQLANSIGQCSVHRAHFLDEMVKLVEGDVARFGKRLVDFEHLENGDVRLKFQDGTEAVHDAVIGCDGIKSKMREVLLGREHPATRAVFSGKYAYRGLIPMGDAIELIGEELARNSQMYCGYHGHLLTFPIEKGKTMNVVAFASREDWDDPRWVVPVDQVSMLKDFEGWGPHVHSILSLMKKTDTWALFSHPPAPTYYRGRACLLGDAAHASTPHQGAGAGMGIEDALVMQHLLAGVDEKSQIEDAFAAFDQMRRERTQKMVATSLKAGQLYDFEKESAKDDITKVRDELSVRMRWIWDFDLKAHLKDSRALLQSLLSKGRAED